MASDLTDLINSDSVKGDLDDSFDGLIDDSWNHSASFLDSVHPLVILSPDVLCLGPEVGHDNLMLLDVMLCRWRVFNRWGTRRGAHQKAKLLTRKKVTARKRVTPLQILTQKRLN